MYKVCHVTSAHPAFDVRIFEKECVSLAKNNYETYLVQEGESGEVKGVHIVGLGKRIENRFKRILLRAFNAYKIAVKIDADLYHIHDPELLPYALLLKIKNKIVVFDSHENYSIQIKNKEYLPCYVSIILSRLYSVLERFVLSRIDALVFPCTMNGKNPFEGLCKRVHIISNAAILSEFYNLYDSSNKKVSKQICYVGSIAEARGVTNNILAANAAGARIALAGPVSSLKYFEMLQMNNSFSCVDYKGILNRKQVAELIANSNLGLCTLLDVGQYLHLDTFSIKVFEYMSMGIPVLLSNSLFNCKMIKEHKFGICVDPYNVEEIKEAIKFVLANPSVANEMGMRGRQLVREKYNWSIEEQKLLSLYHELLNTV